VRWPPLWPDHENFLQATSYENVRFFCHFLARIAKFNNVCISKFQKNGRICSFHWTFRSKKCFSFRGALPPWPLDQGLCPWTPLGAEPPDPRYRLALRALAMAPPLCQILNTPLTTVVVTSCSATCIKILVTALLQSQKVEGQMIDDWSSLRLILQWHKFAVFGLY